ncbi:hypothetical protein PG994_011837 [Apiospora phragmitis]|uniref:Uncharacterized protein n=1 Tax=Apiospora phragmitis TaxID=2905665 RepID=A0ABR1TU98_9PEZI
MTGKNDGSGPDSKRKRELIGDDTDDDDASVQDYERASRKRTCRRVIKEEPDNDQNALLSLPEHPQDKSPVKNEEDGAICEAGRESLLTPPPSPPRYYHPAFPNQPVRCRHCEQTDTVRRVPAARSNLFNEGRLQFTCSECGQDNRFGSFISWADTTGIYEDNITCLCGLPSRADLTTRCRPSGRVFFTCALGKCGFRD